MNDITFEKVDGTEFYKVVCPSLPTKHSCYVEQIGARYAVSTSTSSHFARRRHRVVRRSRRFDSFAAACDAAAKYVKSKIAQAERQKQVRYGHGQYWQGRNGVWWVEYLTPEGKPIETFDEHGNRIGIESPRPVASKKSAKQWLDHPHEYIAAKLRELNAEANVTEGV